MNHGNVNRGDLKDLGVPIRVVHEIDSDVNACLAIRDALIVWYVDIDTGYAGMVHGASLIRQVANGNASVGPGAMIAFDLDEDTDEMELLIGKVDQIKGAVCYGRDYDAPFNDVLDPNRPTPTPVVNADGTGTPGVLRVRAVGPDGNRVAKDVADLKPSTIDTPLDSAFRGRAERLHRLLVRFSSVLTGGRDRAAWVDTFRGEHDPVRELKAYNRILTACQTFAEQRPDIDRGRVARTVLLLSIDALDVAGLVEGVTAADVDELRRLYAEAA